MPLQIIRQDITKMRVDAIVNTTNREMFGYSGVDLAVHEAAGPELDAECRRLAPIKKGEATVTRGYRLGCKYIIHTVGPLWRGGHEHEKELLESCYISCLLAALDRGCETIALPLMSIPAGFEPRDRRRLSRPTGAD